MEQEFVEAESEGKQEFQSLRDDVKNKVPGPLASEEW
jgi:hypothetical protein